MKRLARLRAALESALLVGVGVLVALCRDLPHEGPHVFVSGNVLDLDTDAPIESVLVALHAPGVPYDAYTNELGAFTVTAPPFDSMRLSATKSGYVEADTLLRDVDVSIDELTLFLQRE